MFVRGKYNMPAEGKRILSTHIAVNANVDEIVGLLPPPRDNTAQEPMLYTSSFGLGILFGELIPKKQKTKLI